MRQTIADSEAKVRVEEQRMRRIPGAASRELPVYHFDRDTELSEAEEVRWTALTK
eukprot:gene41271-60291_t